MVACSKERVSDSEQPQDDDEYGEKNLMAANNVSGRHVQSDGCVAGESEMRLYVVVW